MRNNDTKNVVKSRRRPGFDVRVNPSGSVTVFMDIASWETMKKVRTAFGEYLPDMPMWKSEKHWVQKGEHRNNFRWDGEFVLTFPSKAKSAVEEFVYKTAH